MEAETRANQAMESVLYADRKTAELYAKAAGKVSGEVAESLRSLGEDYASNARRLADELDDASTQPAEEIRLLEQDLLRMIDDAIGEADVLEALLMAERTNGVLFRAADQTEPPISQARLLAKHHEDQQHHARFIEARIPQASRFGAGEPASGGMGVHALEADRRHEDGSTAPVDQGLTCITGMTDDRNPDDFE